MKPPTSISPSVARFRFRVMILFIAGLVLSGVTAFPLLSELNLLAKFFAPAAGEPGSLSTWILTVRDGLAVTYARYPWLGYGTDWLAFGHLAIALFFVGPVFQTRSARATLYAGIAACIGVIPLALICGAIRGIPLFWRAIDCSFGVLGILPLLYGLRLLRSIEAE